MIATAIARALAQLTDRRFAGVLAKGLGLTLALLVGLHVALFEGLRWLLPDQIWLPWIGSVGWIDDATSWASVAVLLIASVFLMIPVASAVVSLFLDDVADAVEARHYPDLPPPLHHGLLAAIRGALAFFAAVVVANLIALAAYLALPPFAPVIFVVVNGYLLGREYFELVALRRMTQLEARAARRRHIGVIWLAGMAMAVPLVVPVLNLVVPIVGAATFTHLVQRLTRPR